MSSALADDKRAHPARASGFLRPEDKVVLFNTGSAYKYLDVIAAQEKKARPETPAARTIGGIIGPF